MGDYPDLGVEYSKVFMASGSLSLTINPAAISTEAGVINSTWKDGTGYGNAKATDRPILIAFCESLNPRSFIVSDASRSAETASLRVQQFSGKQVHTWIGFLSQNGKDVATFYRQANYKEYLLYILFFTLALEKRKEKYRNTSPFSCSSSCQTKN